MSHRSLFWPLSLIAIAGLTFLLLLINTSSHMGVQVVLAATACPSDPNDPAYPFCMQTAAVGSNQQIEQVCPTLGPNNIPPYPPYQECILTQTALTQQTTQKGTVTPLNATSTPTNATGTPTATPTSTRTAAATNTPQSSSGIQPTNAVIPTNVSTTIPTATLTPTPEGPSTLRCIPGETLTIEGTTNPHTALIVTFAERPVGGGFSRADGYYRIALRIGNERPGTYPVMVEDRTTRKVVQELVCQVPSPSPTPTP